MWFRLAGTCCEQFRIAQCSDTLFGNGGATSAAGVLGHHDAPLAAGDRHNVFQPAVEALLYSVSGDQGLSQAQPPVARRHFGVGEDLETFGPQAPF